jgi:hypothetical protein
LAAKRRRSSSVRRRRWPRSCCLSKRFSPRT